MDIKTKLEADFKTLDEENPIDVVAEDVVLELQRLGLKYYGEDTIAGFDGFTDLEDPMQFKANFSIRTRKDGKWTCPTLIEVFCEWKQAPGAIFHIYEIKEH